MDKVGNNMAGIEIIVGETVALDRNSCKPV